MNTLMILAVIAGTLIGAGFGNWMSYKDKSSLFVCLSGIVLLITLIIAAGNQ